MIKKVKKSRAARIGIYSVLILIIVFLLMWKILNVYFKEKGIEYAKDLISASTDKRYVLSIEDISINLFTQAITLKELIIEPTNKDLSYIEQYVFKLKSVKVSSFSISSYLQKRNLEIGRVELEEPEFSLYEGTKKLNGSGFSKSKTSLYSVFSGKLRSVNIDEIVIRKAQISAFKGTRRSDSYFGANGINISIKKFKVDSITNVNSKLFVSEKFDLSIGRFEYKFNDGLYTVLGKRVYTSYTDSVIAMDSLQLIPNYNKEQFTKEAGRQISRIKIDLGNVTCKKTNVRFLLEQNRLTICKMNLNGCIIEVYRNNTAFLEPIEKPSFQALLKKLPFVVKVDTIQMYNGKVISEVLNPREPFAVKLDLTRMNGIVTGLNNDSLSYTEKSEVKVKLNTYILDKAKIDLTYVFPLKQAEEHFYCTGTLASVPMALFNPVIPKTMNVLIKKGRIDSSSFSFVTHGNSSAGSMKLMYHDLKIEILAKKGTRGIKEKLESYVVNELIVKEANPTSGEMVRVSRIKKVHNPYRFFIFYSIQSMISGVVPTIINKKNMSYLTVFK